MANENEDIPRFQRFDDTMRSYQNTQSVYNEEANKAYDKNLETINRKTGESFDPIIGRPSFPEELKQERRRIEDIRKNQINPLQKDRAEETKILKPAHEEAEKKRKEFLENPEIINRVKEKEESKKPSTKLKNELDDIDNEIQKFRQLMARTGLDFTGAIKSKTEKKAKIQQKLDEELEKESKLDKKMEELDIPKTYEAKVTDLTKDELKEYSKIGLDALEKQKEVIDELKETAEFKNRDKVIKSLQDDYWDARKELAKKEAPYAIRNAFMIIDLIQKSLQNVGRALPKSKYSPAYTDTPMEEPELFKLWRSQIEKQQDFKQKTIEQQMGSITDRLADMYQLDKSFIKEHLLSDLSWENKYKQLGFNEEEAFKNLEIKLRIAEYEDRLSDSELAALYNAATIDQMMKGGRTLQDVRLAKFYADNAPTIDHVLSWVRLGGYASEVGKEILDNIPMAKLSPVGGVVLGVLKGIQDISDKDNEELVQDISLITGYAVKDIAGALKEIDDALKSIGEGIKTLIKDGKSTDKKSKSEIQSAKKAYEDSVEEFNQSQNLYNKYYAEYEIEPKKMGNKSKVSTQANVLREKAKELKKKKQELINKLKVDQKTNGIDHEAEIEELNNLVYEADIKKL